MLVSAACDRPRSTTACRDGQTTGRRPVSSSPPTRRSPRLEPPPSPSASAPSGRGHLKLSRIPVEPSSRKRYTSQRLHERRGSCPERGRGLSLFLPGNLAG